MQATVCKVIDFPAAHRNLHHDGHCSNVHGHTWTLEIRCKGKIVEDGEAPSYGMVVDFSDIKRVYKEQVEPFVEHQYLNEMIDLPEYTTEHIAHWIFKQMKPYLPQLLEIKLWEGKSSWASVREGDRL